MFNFWKKICAAVMLLIFSMTAIFAEPLTERGTNSTDGSTRYYSDMEVTELVNELSEAAESAIEKAAAEAARAAALASLEREAAAIAESQKWHREYGKAKTAGIKNAVLAGVICFFVGVAVGGVGVGIILAH